jgi:predicted HicB family RNase H-like nuclease
MTARTLSYKGYVATIERDERDDIYWGKVLGMTDRITFEGETLQALADDFHNAIDFYLSLRNRIDHRTAEPCL